MRSSSAFSRSSWKSRLLPAFPGTIAAPETPPRSAAALESSRNRPFWFFPPRQERQGEAETGWTSRAKSTDGFEGAASCGQPGAEPASRTNIHTPRLMDPSLEFHYMKHSFDLSSFKSAGAGRGDRAEWRAG